MTTIATSYSSWVVAGFTFRKRKKQTYERSFCAVWQEKATDGNGDDTAVICERDKKPRKPRIYAV